MILALSFPARSCLASAGGAVAVVPALGLRGRNAFARVCAVIRESARPADWTQSLALSALEVVFARRAIALWQVAFVVPAQNAALFLRIRVAHRRVA